MLWLTKYSGCSVKKAKNTILAKLALKNKMCVVLDGPDTKTTKALIKAGVRRSLIFQPNNSDDYFRIRRKYRNASHESVGEFIDVNIHRRFEFGCLDLDYMTIFTGNKKDYSTPKRDLQSIFENQLLCNNSVLALTLAVDYHAAKERKWSEDAYYTDVFEALSFVTKLAAKHGYYVTVEDKPGIYRNTKARVKGAKMFCLIFRVFITGQ